MQATFAGKFRLEVVWNNHSPPPPLSKADINCHIMNSSSYLAPEQRRHHFDPHPDVLHSLLHHSTISEFFFCAEYLIKITRFKERMSSNEAGKP